MSAPVILLVEDHVDTREMYVEVLKHAGFSTVEATTAGDALLTAVTVRPALVITDLRLGAGLDGLELCEKLRKDPATKGIPMIVLTAYTGDQTLRARADAAGCAAVLLKPIGPEALLAVIRKVMQQPSDWTAPVR